MRKLTVAFAALAAAVPALLCLSCQDVIFDTIRQEIKLEDAQVNGTVNSIVRYTLNGEEHLFCQNGTIWKKSVQAAIAAAGTDGTETRKGGTWAEPYSGQWTRVPQPGANIIKLAADATYLYALSAPTYADNEDTGNNVEAGRTVYCTTDGESWNPVEVAGSTTLSSDKSNIFCTNTPQSAHRHAYLRVDKAVYELSGGSVSEPLPAGSADHATKPTASTNSATVLGNDVYFSSGDAMCSNETSTDDATYIYYNDGDDLYYSKGGTSWTKAGDPGDTIYAMAYTSDYLLLGTSSGLIHVRMTAGTYEAPVLDDNGDPVLDDDGNPKTETKTDTRAGVPGGRTDDFGTNAESTLSSYYQVRTIIAVDPSLTETAGDLYGSTSFSGMSASFSNVVLWGYYPGRGKWNCE